MRAGDCARSASRIRRDPNRGDDEGRCTAASLTFARPGVRLLRRRRGGSSSRMHERQRGVFVGAHWEISLGMILLRSGDCHAMFVSVMSRKCARLMAARKNDRNAQALPLITGSMLRPGGIIVYYVRVRVKIRLSLRTRMAQIINRIERR